VNEMIPARNEISIAKEKVQRPKRRQRYFDQVETLARLYRAGALKVNELKPELCDDICVWLLNHKRLTFQK